MRRVRVMLNGQPSCLSRSSLPASISSTLPEQQASRSVRGAYLVACSLEELSKFSGAPQVVAGVITKIAVIQYRHSLRMIYGENRLQCRNCGKNSPCLCKKCTLERLKYYSKKENISISFKRKECLETEIDLLLSEKAAIEISAHKVAENVTRLRRELERRRAVMEMKREELGAMRKCLASSSATIKRLNDLTKRKRPVLCQDELLNREQMLHEKRRRSCLLLFGFFPLSKWEAESDDVTVEEKVIYSIRSARVGMKMLERPGETMSAVSCSPAEGSALAALCFSVQLVSLLGFILDIRLPSNFLYLMSLLPLSTRVSSSMPIGSRCVRVRCTWRVRWECVVSGCATPPPMTTWLRSSVIFWMAAPSVALLPIFRSTLNSTIFFNEQMPSNRLLNGISSRNYHHEQALTTLRELLFSPILHCK